MSFYFEETAEAVDRGAVGGGGGYVAPTYARQRQARSPEGVEPRLFRGHSANWRGVAILAGTVSFAFDLLAATPAMGGGRRLAAKRGPALGSAG